MVFMFTLDMRCVNNSIRLLLQAGSKYVESFRGASFRPSMLNEDGGTLEFTNQAFDKEANNFDDDNTMGSTPGIVVE